MFSRRSGNDAETTSQTKMRFSVVFWSFKSPLILSVISQCKWAFMIPAMACNFGQIFVFFGPIGAKNILHKRFKDFGF